jgi:hypothetical protein
MLRKIFYIVCLEQRKIKQKKKKTHTQNHQKWEPLLPAKHTHTHTHTHTKKKKWELEKWWIRFRHKCHRDPRRTSSQTPWTPIRYGSSPHSSSPRTSTPNPTFQSSVPSSPSTRSDPSLSPTAPPLITSSLTLSTASSGPNLGRLPRSRSDQESRERVEKESREREEPHACFGKWFKEKNFVNRFPFFSEGFSGQLQIISVDFYFIAKQIPANDENVLQKMF